MDFIRSLPGWRDSSWPTPMTLDENRADLECHARGFAERTQFCYSVLQPGGGPVVGCVYVKPTVPLHDGTAEVRSWVSAGHAGLDVPLYDAVAAWLRDAWPFDSVEYAAR